MTAEAPSGCPVQHSADEPRLDFGGTTPYEDYVHASTLHELQRPVTDEPLEMSFLVVTQVMELYFGLLAFDLRYARDRLEADDVREGTAALRRCTTHLKALRAAWLPIARMTPREFNTFRHALGEGSGFQSAAYRHVEFLLGEKSASMLAPHRSVPAQHAELSRALGEPGVYDASLALLARRGHGVPDDVLNRDLTLPYTASLAVEEAWTKIYATDAGHLIRLGEALSDVAEEFTGWRHDHLMATRRAMGSKPGTGGSAGVSWLEKRARRDIFPELWTARARV
ncbi:tryptophan 2,3-dioxygenase family protein [Actinoallomurus purpureus]|uniref:tryptophan 2,3-dioxygenase n=1 Tax=Actinoallomurus purpureus TaxID=478114 RepID=UPI0020926D80|nr:tryptophan 2,3-dioxygenase family protein [Actinoallomurus purpureus]MCO6009757.1 tryptophan 2,3-dioxygenase family protein [Actinoallomurus purpureus]